jgi:hypothetical protein
VAKPRRWGRERNIMIEEGYAPVACLSIHSWRVAGVPGQTTEGRLTGEWGRHYRCAHLVLNAISLQLVNSTVNETGSQKKLAWKLSQTGSTGK